MLALPKELNNIIACFLSQKDMLPYRLVCRYFQSIFLEYVKTKEIKLNRNITDDILNELMDKYNFKMLNLTLCKNITDVSILGNVHTLNLRNCDITDVSNLGNIHTLDLSRCYNIIDVSMLGNIYKLDLSCCRNIRDVSSLGNVHTLIQ